MTTLRRVCGGVLAVILTAAGTEAQPATDIYLGELANRDGKIEVRSLRNITDRDGYDNQPSFTPDGTRLLYTSIREGQADAYRYELASGAIVRLTHTTESEYSPTVMPGGEAFSVVQVEADSTQRLWHFDFDGENLGVVLEDVKPVGYHAWGDDTRVALFVLGDPATLQLADVRTGQAEIIETNIGRSLHQVPGQPAISFIHQISESESWIKQLDLFSGDVETLVRTLPESQDYAWTPDGAIVMGQGSRLYSWRPGGEDTSEWQQIAELADHGIADITRIAVSPRGDLIAIVSSRPRPRP